MRGILPSRFGEAVGGYRFRYSRFDEGTVRFHSDEVEAIDEIAQHA